MRNPWGIVAICRSMVRNAWNTVAGDRIRQLGMFVFLGTLALLAYVLTRGDRETKIFTDLQSALETTRFFESESRELSDQYEEERQRRILAEQTIEALATNIKEQDKIILDLKQQVSFLRQLFEERNQAESSIAVRTFNILPDFRENSYQLEAIVSRQGTEDNTFAGRMDLLLSLVDDTGRVYEYRPEFLDGETEIEFRHYHEAQLYFTLPDNTEILNAQLVLFDSETGNPVISQTLGDQDGGVIN